ncbi:MAG: S8 family serine peptidase, partial [Solimonas sp.]
MQNSLGITGEGIRVAVMDTGIDYDNADLGGDGVQRSNSTVFPTARVIAGWDFVGDAFNFDQTPVPDPYPDDCGGHGTHVSGIVGANGVVKGVAPGVSFGAYRVFGCGGSTTSDIMLAAMERALADGMQVLNMSIGARAQHPKFPTAAAATRLLRRGMVVVASIGNNGPGGNPADGPYGAGAPGVGADVIGVASYDNTQLTQKAFTANPGNLAIGFNTASGAPPPPASGTLSLSATSPSILGCAAADFAGFPAGNAALISRGTCTFFQKATNAQAAGATAVVLYNNVAGALNPTVAGTPAITIPVVAVTQSAGSTLAALPGGTITWGNQVVVSAIASGGLISSFSSFGMAADLTIK